MGGIKARRRFDVSIYHSMGREDEVDEARGHRGVRHPFHLRRIILRERDSALRLDLLRTERSVGRRARQDDRDGARALILRK